MTVAFPESPWIHLEIEKVCSVIERREKDAETQPDKKRLREAAIAVCFVWEGGNVHNFEDLMACFSRRVTPGQIVSFDTRPQAQTRLKQARDLQQPPRVSVAGVWHSIVYSLDRGDIELIRVPTVDELTSVHQSTGILTDEISAALQRATARTRAPEDMESILTALLALYFIVATGQTHDFEGFLLDFDSRAVGSPLRVFESRQHAEDWLKSHPRPPPGARVEISGQRFSVGYDRESGLRVLVRSPTLEELGLSGPTYEQDS